MNPLIQQLLAMGAKNVPGIAKNMAVNFGLPLGFIAGSNYYQGRGLPGSDRDLNFPNAPSPAEDLTNAAWMATAPAGGVLGISMLPLNPLVRELYDKKAQGYRYERNKAYADNYARGLEQDRQGVADYNQFSKLVNDQQQQAIKIAADMRQRGATVDQIKEALRTRKTQVTPGDILRGNPNWKAQWPTGFRQGSVLPNEAMLRRNTNSP
jgi:hypothetical protein